MGIIYIDMIVEILRKVDSIEYMWYYISFWDFFLFLYRIIFLVRDKV